MNGERCCQGISQMIVIVMNESIGAQPFLGGQLLFLFLWKPKILGPRPKRVNSRPKGVNSHPNWTRPAVRNRPGLFLKSAIFLVFLLAFQGCIESNIVQPPKP